MTESIDAEVARILSTIPVRASRQMTATEYQVRVAEVLNLFDIEAVGDETGIRYGGEGVELEDQPLEAAVRILIGSDSASRKQSSSSTGRCPSDLVSASPGPGQRAVRSTH